MVVSLGNINIQSIGYPDGLDTVLNIDITAGELLALSAMVGFSNQYIIAQHISEIYDYNDMIKNLIQRVIKEENIDYNEYVRLFTQIQQKIGE